MNVSCGFCIPLGRIDFVRSEAVLPIPVRDAHRQSPGCAKKLHSGKRPGIPPRLPIKGRLSRPLPGGLPGIPPPESRQGGGARRTPPEGRGTGSAGEGRFAPLCAARFRLPANRGRTVFRPPAPSRELHRSKVPLLPKSAPPDAGIAPRCTFFEEAWPKTLNAPKGAKVPSLPA